MPVAVVMYHPRNRFLTGTVFPQYQYRHIGWSDQFCLFFTFYGLCACPFEQMLFTVPDSGHVLEECIHKFKELFPVNRFHQIVLCSEFDRTHRVRIGSVFGHYHKWNMNVFPVYPFKQFYAISLRQSYI